MRKTLVASAILAASTGASAGDIVCRNCDAAFPGRYLGAYWPADRGSFTGGTTISPSLGFSQNFVFDLNDNSSFTVSADALLQGFRAEFYISINSVCGAETCSQVTFDTLIACTHPAASGCQQIDPATLTSQDSRRWTLRINDLSPGRYVLRVLGSTTPSGGSYSGAVRVKH